MNELKTFGHAMFGELPVLVVEGVEWFGATEAAKALSFGNPYKAVDNHVEQEDCTVHTVLTNGGKQQKKFINESGLYSLIFGAAKQGNNTEIKEKAKKFKRWVTSEILPTIRKHGAYMTPDTIDNIISDPDFGIKLLTALKEEKEKRVQAEQAAQQANLVIEQQRPKVVYAEAVEVSEDTVLVKDLAAILTQKGVSIGEKRLFVWLRENGYLCKQKGEMWNMPTQRSLDLGVIVVKHGVRTGSGGEMKKTRTPKITGKGQVYFINKLLKETGLIAI